MNWLDYANLSDNYERRARFLPAVLSVLPLLPACAALGGPVLEWVKLIIGGVGIGAVLSVGLSHVASAMGNQLQARLWPRWPLDSPTNRWLHPDEKRTSAQQRAIWYEAVKRQVGIDIASAVKAGKDVESTINDATAVLRNRFGEHPEAERLRLHNIQYGFARNFAGMRPIWCSFLVASAIACWCVFCFVEDGTLLWPIVSSSLLLVMVPIGMWVLPMHVRIKADYYAESFFATLTAIDGVAEPQLASGEKLSRS